MKLTHIVFIVFFINTLLSAPANASYEPGYKKVATKLGAQNGEKGASVSVSGDGKRLAAGDPANGAVYVYEIDDDNNLNLLGEEIVSNEIGARAGEAISLNNDGTIVAVGAPRYKDDENSFASTGQVRVYQYDEGEWALYGNIINGETSGDEFGWSVALSSDGLAMAVGAIGYTGDGSQSYSGLVQVYEFINGDWSKKGSGINGAASFDESGSAVSLSDNGQIVAVGVTGYDGEGDDELDIGQVRIYEFTDGDWELKGSGINGESAGDNFGGSVSLSANGLKLAVGAVNNDGADGTNTADAGHVRVFEFTDDNWRLLGDDIDGKASGDAFGSSVSLSGDGLTLAIGAPVTDEFTGSVSVFEYTNESWTQHGPDMVGSQDGDYLGNSVSISSDGKKMAVGIPKNSYGNAGAGSVVLYEKNINYTANEGVSYDYTSEQEASSGDEDAVQTLTMPSVDKNGDALVYTISTQPSKGAITLNGTAFTYTPVLNSNGVDSFTYTVTDNPGNADRAVTQTAFINVISVNYAPKAFNLTRAVVKNQSTTFSLISSDKDNDALSYSIVSMPTNGAAVISENSNQLTYTPNKDFTGADSFTYRVTDDSNANNNKSDIKTVLMTVVHNYRDDALIIGSSGNFEGGEQLTSVSISANGQVIAVGLPSSSKTRIYQYSSDTASWAQLGSDIDGEARYDEFGRSVSLSANGQVVAIGAPDNDINGNFLGHVRVYQYSTDTARWTQLGEDIDSEVRGDESGASVSLSADGQVVAIGAPNNGGNGPASGHVRIYQYSDTQGWTQLGHNIDGESEDRLGLSVGLSADGQTVAIGAPNDVGNGSPYGYVRIYQYSNDAARWTQLGGDIDGEVGGDESGASVSLSADGQVVAIGAPNNGGNGPASGHVRIYQYSSGTTRWIQLGSDIDGEAFGDISGASVSLSADGQVVAIGAPYNDGNGKDSGHVRIYQYSSDTADWKQLGEDIGGEDGDDALGLSVSLSADGRIVVMSGFIENSPIRVFSLTNEAAPVANDQKISMIKNETIEISITGSDADGDILTFIPDLINLDDMHSLSRKGSSKDTFTFTPDSNFIGIVKLGFVASDGYAVGDKATVEVTVNLSDKDADGIGDTDDAYPLVAIGDLTDTDSDGAPDNCDDTCIELGMAADDDDDGDGVADTADTYPLIAIGELTDTDSDGVPDTCDDACVGLGMAADTDDDNDGIADTTDTYPLIAIGELTDTDLDGAPDTCNEACIELGMAADTDDDNDGVVDTTDAYPLITIGELVDTDSDGAPDTCDEACVELGMTADDDDDNDGIPDTEDTYPLIAIGNLVDVDSDGAPDTCDEACVALGMTADTDGGNRTPQAFNLSRAVVKNQSTTFSLIGSDKDGDTLSYSIVSMPTNGAAVISENSNQLTYTPNKDFTGTDSFTYRVTDDSDTESDKSAIKTVLMTVVHSYLGNPVQVADFKGDSKLKSVSISANGQVIAVGLPGNSKVSIYQYSNDTAGWAPLGSDIDGEAITDYFGYSVSLSADGRVVAIGATRNGNNSGHVRIYQYSTETQDWKQLGSDIDGDNIDDLLGVSVSLSADGQVVAIGAPYSNLGDAMDTALGYARVYRYSKASSTWTQLGSDIDGEDSGGRSGVSVSLSANGQVVAIGAYRNDGNGNDSGHVRVYQYSTDTARWTQLGEDIDGEANNDFSGFSVSLSASGQVVAIGALGNDGNGTNSGHVRIYQYSSDTQDWEQLGDDIDGEAEGDESGHWVSLSADGQVLAIGAPKNDANGPTSGHVRIYQYSTETEDWNRLGSDIDGEVRYENFGDSVSLSADGRIVVIEGGGAVSPASSLVRVFRLTNDGVPVANDQKISMIKNETIEISITGSDADGDILTFIPDLINLDDMHSLSRKDGSKDTFTFTPGKNYIGVVKLGFAASDGYAISDKATVEVTVELSDKDADGIPDIDDTYPLVAIGELTDTDSDGAPDACDDACIELGMSADSDDDNDGVPDTEDVFPQDGTKTTLLDDEIAPVVIAPADIYVDATGELTEVDIGLATVDDNLEELVATADNLGPFASGETLVTWTVLDSAGNEGQATQSVFITPQVSIADSAQILTNETLSVSVYLSGPAVNYPVLIPITVNLDTVSLSTNELEILTGTEGPVTLIVEGNSQPSFTLSLGEPENAVLGSSTQMFVTISEKGIPAYTYLEQPQPQFETLTPTAKIIVTGSQGDNFFDIARYVDEVSVVGQTFLFSGSSEVDGVVIQPGVKYDLTNLKGSIDKLYFSGPLSEYADSILLDTATGVMQLSRLTDIGEEIVQFIATASAADELVFTDGAISTADIKAVVTSGTTLTDLTLNTTIKALDDKTTTGATVKHIVLDNNGAGVMALGPNISTLISGSSGVDQIYVPVGSNVDASNLKSSQDEIYLQGNLADYTSEFDSSGNIVLSRDVVVDDETQSERVVLASGGNAATNDLVIFKDQQVDTATLKQQVLD